ncbi:hypothetical protein CO172_02170 [Candidatus Uhrbacteria bacterium CG_4_9_14_3_um_filter_36_7]|uniref:Uncharacterized protein n=1 Tax=Candidatus Uhrbacteria bacterium CG_4_9_14_3_um_filter_36_7 TaxID=1975033 RepID=A0A2M7XHU9_9BACT|nr:MAG: hypothetical protein CO172_02170 [Candidatus Uhrbacteria bacterium CG_4_9_14_3_um_filter_36_7]
MKVTHKNGKRSLFFYRFWMGILFILFGIGSGLLFLNHFSFLWQEGSVLWEKKTEYQYSLSSLIEEKKQVFEQEVGKEAKAALEEALYPFEQERLQQEQIIEAVADSFEEQLEVTVESP